MADANKPKLRKVEKYKTPYKINKFPQEFGMKLGKEIIYLLTTKGNPVLEGSEWEEIFANCIGASWKPSNIGLDDVVMHQCAWGAKTVKGTNPKSQKMVRLISGRNSPSYSFGQNNISEVDPNKIGAMVLSIWNERVEELSKNYKELRTVVLIKSNDLTKVVVFEINTVIFPADEYTWIWNKNNNLEGRCKRDDSHKFTWQPHGSQFTIIETVPPKSLYLEIDHKINAIDKSKILESIGYEDNWLKISTNDD